MTSNGNVMMTALHEFVDKVQVQTPFDNGTLDYQGNSELALNLLKFSPKIYKMMTTIATDDHDRSRGPFSMNTSKKMSDMAKRFKRHDVGTDKPPIQYLGIHFIFLPTMDGDTLFDGPKDEYGRLACHGDPETNAQCLGTLAYAMRAFGIRVIPTNPRIKACDLKNENYYMSFDVKKEELSQISKLTGKTLNPKQVNAVKGMHEKIGNSLESSILTCAKVIGFGSDTDYDQGDEIKPGDCQRVCIALGGQPASLQTLECIGKILNKKKLGNAKSRNAIDSSLRCEWKRKIRSFPERVLQEMNRNGSSASKLERYRGMLDSRHNKAALQFFLEVIHKGVVDKDELKKDNIVIKNPEIACNYKRAVMFTHPVIKQDTIQKLFVHPLNQDGLILRFIAVHLRHAVGLNIKPVDMIHKPDIPDNDGTDIQSSARALRSCPFHKDNISECIQEQVGGVHRRCYVENNVVLRRDYVMQGEDGIRRLDKQKRGQNIFRDLMASFSADCVDHSQLHLRVHTTRNGVSKDPSSILDPTNTNKTTAVCFTAKGAQNSTRVVSPRYEKFPLLELMEFMPLTKEEFVDILNKKAGGGSEPDYVDMINKIKRSSKSSELLRSTLNNMEGLQSVISNKKKNNIASEQKLLKLRLLFKFSNNSPLVDALVKSTNSNKPVSQKNVINCRGTVDAIKNDEGFFHCQEILTWMFISYLFYSFFVEVSDEKRRDDVIEAVYKFVHHLYTLANKQGVSNRNMAGRIEVMLASKKYLTEHAGQYCDEIKKMQEIKKMKINNNNKRLDITLKLLKGFKNLLNIETMFAFSAYLHSPNDDNVTSCFRSKNVSSKNVSSINSSYGANGALQNLGNLVSPIGNDDNQMKTPVVPVRHYTARNSVSPARSRTSSPTN